MGLANFQNISTDTVLKFQVSVADTQKHVHFKTITHSCVAGLNLELNLTFSHLNDKL